LSSNTNIGNTPVNQGYVQLIHTGETGGIDGTLRTLYDGDGTASDLQIASNAVKVSTTLYIGSDTLQEYIQDTVGAMFDTNGSHTNLTATYDDNGDGAIDLNATGAIASIIAGTGITTSGSGNITINVDTSSIATRSYVDTEVAGLVDSAPGTLDTLNELAAALGDDPNFATTTATNIATKLAKASNLSDLTNVATARTNLGVDAAGTDNSTNVTLVTTSHDYLSLSGQAITLGTIDISDDTNLVGGTGITLTGDTLSTTDSEIVHDNLSGFVANEHIDHSTVSISAGSGLSGGGDLTSTRTLSINAIQTAITSIYNSSLKIGSAADEQRIDFGTTDEIRLGSSTQTSVKIKTDPLGSAQDEVIIGDGTADVDFVVDNSSGTTIFKVDAGTGNTAVTGDLDVTGALTSGTFNPTTVSTTNVIAENYKGTGGSNPTAFTVGPTNGNVEFLNNVDINGGNFTLAKSNGSILNLTTTESDIINNEPIGTIKFYATNETGIAANQLAASIVASASGTFDTSNNPTDMVFSLGTTGTATEKFRILSDGKIKIGNSYTLPSSDGSANQILKTNGSGTLSFADESAGISFNGSTANGLLTYGSSTTADVESELTYIQGGALNISGSLYSIIILNETDVTNNPAWWTVADGGNYSIRLNNTGTYPFQITTNASNNAVDSITLGYSTSILGNLTLNDSLTIGSGGNYAAGSIYSDSNWGMIFRAKQASPSLAEFRWANSADSELMRIDTSGNVGIGVTPAQKLHISGNTMISNGSYYMAEDADGDDINLLGIHPNNNVYIGASNNAYAGGFMLYGAASTTSGHVWYSGNAEAMRIDSSQRVGIGTNSPGSYNSAGDNLVIAETSGGAGITLASATNGSGHILFADSTSGTGAYDGFIRYDHTTSSMRFAAAGGVERMRIDSSGNVGIGTVSPTNFGAGFTNLQISGSTAGSVQTTDSTNSATAELFTSGGVGYVGTRSNHSFRIKSNDTTAMTIDTSQNVGIGVVSPARPLVVNGSSATFLSIVSGATSDGGILFGDASQDFDGQIRYNNSSHHMFFKTNNIEQMRISSSGRVSIGNTNDSYKLDVTGDIRVSSGSLGIGVTPNATDGRGDFSNDVVAFSTSDKRLKENIKPLDSALDKVLKISGVEFDWKELTEEEKKTIHGNEGHDVGVIAQEIEEVLPEVVTTRDTGYKAVKYEKIVPLLIEAIKEQQQQINELKEKLNG